MGWEPHTFEFVVGAAKAERHNAPEPFPQIMAGCQFYLPLFFLLHLQNKTRLFGGCGPDVGLPAKRRVLFVCRPKPSSWTSPIVVLDRFAQHFGPHLPANVGATTIVVFPSTRRSLQRRTLQEVVLSFVSK